VVILVTQFGLAALTVLNAVVPFVIVVGCIVGVVALVHPLSGLGLLLVARLATTGATVFVQLGPFGIGPFEVVLVICLAAFAGRASLNGTAFLRGWPWLAPFVLFLGWMGISLAWSVNRVEGLQDLLPLVLVLVNAALIVGMVRTVEDFHAMMRVWLGACVLIGLIAIATGIMDVDIGHSFKAAMRGGRETGLGQQPNWFAMNLIFIIHSAFGMALLQPRWTGRLLYTAAGIFVFFMMVKAGSRGGACATAIGGVIAALFHGPFRRWFLRFFALAVALFAIGLRWDIMNSGRAMDRILSSITLGQNYRPGNWRVCLKMFQDTFGRGIGAGGYMDLLPEYHYKLSQSLYNYPHGIPWELIAHYGVVGILLFGVIVFSVLRMNMDLIRMTKGTELEVFAWTMPAALAGYAGWCFFEFTVTEKPVWEFLALYTALYVIVRRSQQQESDCPRDLSGPLPWNRQSPHLPKSRPVARPMPPHRRQASQRGE
jgi:hypothetical protein